MIGFGADALRIPVIDADSAAAFYERELGAAVTNDGVESVDLQGTGTIEFVPSDTPLAFRFCRIVVTYVLDQPSEVRAVMDAARKRKQESSSPRRRRCSAPSGSFLAPEGFRWVISALDDPQPTTR